MNKVKYCIFYLISFNLLMNSQILKAEEIKYVSINSKEEAENKENDGAKAENSIAIGTNSSVSTMGKSSIAIGNGANSNNKKTVTIGDSSTSMGVESIAIGATTKTIGNYTVAIGSETTTNSNYAISIGKKSKATEDDTISIGHLTESSAAGAISLGNKSKALGRYSISQGDGANSTGHSAISIGSAAINVNSTGGISIGAYSLINYINLENGTKIQYDKILKVEDSKYEIETPRLSEEEIREKAGNTYGAIALGYRTSSHDIGAISVGMYSTALKMGSLALGQDTSALNEGAISIGRGTKSYGVDSLAIGRYSVAVSDNSVSLGKQTSVLAENSVAIGTLSTVKETDVKDGLSLYSEEKINASDGVVSFGSENIHRRIINVAGGIDENDVVNVKQLKSSIENFVTKNEISDFVKKDELSDLLKDMKGNNKTAFSGIASAMAMSSIPQVIDKNRPITVGGAVSLYKGESAVALGVSGVNKTGNVLFKASSSINTNLDLGASIGVSYSIGNVYNDIADLKTEDKSEIVEYISKLENNFDDYKKYYDKKLEEANKKSELANKKVEELEKKLEILMNNLNENKFEKIVDNKELVKNDNISKLIEEKVFIVSGFDTNDYRLNDKDKSILKTLVNLLNENVSLGIIDVIGHTDLRGGFEYNLDLGLKRAKEIVSILKEYGLKSEIKIRNVSSNGTILPISNQNFDNRRVEIYFDSLELK